MLGRCTFIFPSRARIGLFVFHSHSSRRRLLGSSHLLPTTRLSLSVRRALPILILTPSILTSRLRNFLAALQASHVALVLLLLTMPPRLLWIMSPAPVPRWYLCSVVRSQSSSEIFIGATS